MPSFEEMRLIDPIQRALADQNYQTPTPVQDQAIPAALRGEDILAVAQTGTGKTAAFALPILNALGEVNRKARPWRPFALILSPTRELAVQIGDNLAAYSRHLHLRTALVYGGVSQSKQVRVIKRGVHIIVATPGRLLDLMNQGCIKLDQLEHFVLDEADRMMDMGFLPDIKRVIKTLPAERQSLFFSATMPDSIQNIADSLLQKPKEIRIAPESPSVDSIDQYVVHTNKQKKKSVLYTMLKDEAVTQALVFTRTKRMANTLAGQLEKQGFSADAIHGNKSQNARQKSLDRFRRGHTRTLVATDVVARGIDLDSISHVFNYDVPDDAESYIHRIGRTGRAGAKGTAITFVGNDERRWLRSVERLIKKPIEELEVAGSGGSQRSETSGRSRQGDHKQSARGGKPGRNRRASDDSRETSFKNNRRDKSRKNFSDGANDEPRNSRTRKERDNQRSDSNDKRSGKRFDKTRKERDSQRSDSNDMRSGKRFDKTRKERDNQRSGSNDTRSGKRFEKTRNGSQDSHDADERTAKRFEGAIKRVTQKGFGFIASARGSDTYFNQQSLQGVQFRDLEVGIRVSFSIRKGPKGPCAEGVRLVRR